MKTALLAIALCLVAATCATATAQTKTSTPAEWTQHRAVGVNAMRHSLFIEEGNSRQMCNLYINDDGKTATVILGIDRYSDNRRFVTRRTQYFELVKNKRSNWVVTKEARSGGFYERGPRSLESLEISNEDLRWYFFEDFDRAPIEAQKILQSL